MYFYVFFWVVLFVLILIYTDWTGTGCDVALSGGFFLAFMGRFHLLIPVFFKAELCFRALGIDVFLL